MRIVRWFASLELRFRRGLNRRVACRDDVVVREELGGTVRIEVILASSLSEEKCHKINLGYMDYRQIDLEQYKSREDEGILFVDRAGEILHRVKD